MDINDYRKLARHHVQAARAILDADDGRDQFAALELRQAIEAFIYDVAKGYADDFPPEYEVWQPAKLLGALLNIAPLSDATLSLHIQAEPKPGETEGEWLPLGTDKRLTLKEIKENYDALGAYLHVPTLKQIRTGKIPNRDRLRRRCLSIVSRLEEVTESSLWGLSIRATSTLNCLNCGNKVTRCVNALTMDPKKRLAVDCFSCEASYEVERAEDGYTWTALSVPVPCRHEGCDGSIEVWRRQFALGAQFACPKCGRESRIDALLSAVDADSPRSVRFEAPSGQAGSRLQVFPST